jgi:hypothetical protein
MSPEKQVSQVEGFVISGQGAEKELGEQFFHDLLFDVYNAVKLIKQKLAVDPKQVLRPVKQGSS